MKARILPILVTCLAVAWQSMSVWGALVDLNNRSTGLYSPTMLAQDWNTPPWNNGVTQGRASIVSGADAYEGQSLRILYPQGEVGPIGNNPPFSGSGAQWLWEFGNSFDELILEYKVKFASDFDFVLGGKLPGLVGGTANTGGSVPTGYDGWSARMMWLGNGQVVQYVYHPDQPDIYGDSFPWNLGGQRTFTPGVWHTVRHRVVMNTPTLHDGIIQGWFDGQLALDVENLRFRDTDAFAIDTMFFSTFFGGADSSWAPPKNEYVYFDDFLVTVSLADFTGDFMVNSADLMSWTAGYGTSVGARFSQGDADRDADVDGADYLSWQREYTPVGVTLARIPEPSTGLLAMLGTATALSFRRSHGNLLSCPAMRCLVAGLFCLVGVDRSSAASVGDGSVQTWKNGQTAAATFTIDDNWQQDHAWWSATASAYDIRLTWFVITGRVGTGNTAVNGNWSDFAALQAAGHDIQSHTVDHFPQYPNPPYSPLTLEVNYSQAITDIESHVAGSDVLTLAYPYGLVAPNDKTVAGENYIAARGVTGTPNKLVGIDYFNVNSLSTDAYATTGFQYPGHDVGRAWADVSQLLTPGNQYYKGWFSVHSHGMTTEKKNAITGLLDYMTAQPDGYWFGSFTEVAQYARERDTASLATNVISPEEIQYTLTDTLDDEKFYEPLTVKLRVDNTWTQIVAMQNGHALPASLILVGGEQYALINSVPDTGVVSLREFLPPTADFDVDGDTDGVDFLAWQRGFGISSGATLGQGDANHDGAVNAADLSIWQNEYGTALTTAALAVPEPASAILLLAGVALWQLLSGS